MSEALTYPDVPVAPGVPPVPRLAAGSPDDIALMDSDTVGNLGYYGSPWGIFDDNGDAVVVPDTVVALNYRHEFRVPDYPIEQGGFGSYNKVARPYEVRVTMAKGGSVADCAGFLAAIEGLVSNTSLYTVTTPTATYPNANLTSMEYRRESRAGATMLTVERGLQEIRVTATTQFTQTAAPDGAKPVNQGTVQTQTPAASQMPQIDGLLGHI